MATKINNAPQNKFFFKKCPIYILKASLLILVFLQFYPHKLNAANGRLNLYGKYPVLEAENKVWIGTPSGLYQYSSEEDAYKRFVLPIESQNQEIRYLSYNDEWLWCILDSTLAAFHIRLNEWLVFDMEDGLPSNLVNGLDFTEDYVWIGTEDGMSRYDLLIEEWEDFGLASGIPKEKVNDIVVKDENIWLVNDYKFSEYNPQFEQWRHFNVIEDSLAALKRGFFQGQELWLVSDNGLILFNTTLQTQQTFFLPFLTPNNLLELFIEDQLIWAVTKMGLYVYSQASGVWREFAGNNYLSTSIIRNGFISPSEIWVLTEENVLVYNRMEKNWKILDYASGLSTTQFDASYISGGLAMLINQQGLDYRLSMGDRWRNYEIKSIIGDRSRSVKNLFKNLFDNEAGGYIPLGKFKWSWEGTRMTYIYDYERTYFNNGLNEDPKVLSGERLDIKSQLILGKTRTLSGFYNNIDYSETMYGIRYRSRENDILREFNWGDFRREPGAIPFGETASMFGSNVWLQAGKKTERFKRSLVSLKASTGQRRSQKTYEYYLGALKKFEIQIADADYLRYIYYSIPGLDTTSIPENLEIFIDDLNDSNNSPNTMENISIAGITGDYEILVATEDYYFYDKANVIRFSGNVSSVNTIVVRYTQNSQQFEEILQYDTIFSTVRKNFYSLRAQKIIPSSFMFQMFDTTGQSVPISQFGLDVNGDGRVDAEWVDYGNGILFFPEEEPFPGEVYDPNQPMSVYNFIPNYETEYSLIQLEHDDLVRGTEKVFLEGILAEGGNDYVLDYTNGTLVFVREGVVTTDTRIEVEYEYYLEEVKTRIHSASVNFSPSDNFYLQGDWTRFNKEDSIEYLSDETEDLISLHSEIRHKIGNYDVKITPGLAYQNEEKQLTAYYVEGLVSSSKVRIQTKYENYDKDYSNLHRPQTVLGDINSNLELFASIDAREDLRISGSWEKQQGFSDSTNSFPSERTGNISILFHRPNFPGWKGSYQNQETISDSGTTNKYFYLNNLEYQLPQKWAKKISFNNIKLEAQFRNGEQSGLELVGSDKQQFYQGYFRLNTNITDQFQTSIFYRRNTLNDISDNSYKTTLTRSERMLFNISFEEWRTLQVNLRIENTMDQGFYPDGTNKDARISQYSQLNFRFSPGQIWDKLSILHFEFNVNQSLFGWGTPTQQISSWTWQMFRTNTDELSNSQLIRNYYIKNEFRPGVNYYLYSLFEWNNQENSYGGSALKTDYWQLNEKLEMKIGYKTRVNVQYKQYNQNQGYKRTTKYYEPSVWTEHRWNPNFQNVLYCLYRFTDSRDKNIESQKHRIEGRYDIIWRKKKFLKMRRIEIRQSILVGHTEISGYDPEKSYQLTSSSALDLYPLYSMIFRFQFNAGQYLNVNDPDLNNFSIDFNMKLSLRF
ncbi:MAG: hypothetical protein K8R86_08085 [Bacteroidales bacterium]|nr:hypothetical protein [Bacteroidales bacterium]